jgi:exopolysaccharide production protein ExoY
MSVVSPRDFSAISRPRDVAEGDRVPALSKFEIAGDLVANRSGPAEIARRRFWAVYASGDKARDIHPLGGRSKRAFDMAVAATALFLLAPVFLMIAAAIKLLNGGDVFYRHRRIGFNGKFFDCLKFRTMVTNGDEVLARYFKTNPAAELEWLRTRKLRNDPRITPIGYFLRKTSLDELPQLINILRGQMSCVGPRPIVAEELHFYGEHAADYFRARPGVTGLWQVSGRSLATYEQRVGYDVQYLSRWSLSRDVFIICRTIPAILDTEQAA